MVSSRESVFFFMTPKISMPTMIVLHVFGKNRLPLVSIFLRFISTQTILSYSNIAFL